VPVAPSEDERARQREPNVATAMGGNASTQVARRQSDGDGRRRSAFAPVDSTFVDANDTRLSSLNVEIPPGIIDLADDPPIPTLRLRQSEGCRIVAVP